MAHEVQGRTLFIGEMVWDRDNLVEVVKVEGAWPDYTYTLRERGSGFEYNQSNKWALHEADRHFQYKS